MESKKYKLNQADLLKIVVGACIAVGGALLTYLAGIITQIDFGIYTPVIVAGLSILINVARKALEGK